MIWIIASKAFSITFTVLVITASLERLFVVPRIFLDDPLVNFEIPDEFIKYSDVKNSQWSAGSGPGGPRYIRGPPRHLGGRPRLTLRFLSVCGEGLSLVSDPGYRELVYDDMMIEEFCFSREMQKFKTEWWNHAMVEAGQAAHTDRFHELARLVSYLVTLESRMIERYVYGLASQIRGMVAATEPKTIQKAVQISDALADEACQGM
ncbi:hypothetical protein Tco_0958618 [Tanacetum coccineum]